MWRGAPSWETILRLIFLDGRIRFSFGWPGVILRLSSPPFACVPSHGARDPSPLWSPSLHLNLTHPHQPSCVLSTASPLLTRLAWDVLIPGRAAVESVNSWREGFRGARTGWGSRNGLLFLLSWRYIKYYYIGGVGILPCNTMQS